MLSDKEQFNVQVQLFVYLCQEMPRLTDLNYLVEHRPYVEHFLEKVLEANPSHEAAARKLCKQLDHAERANAGPRTRYARLAMSWLSPADGNN